MNHRYEPLPEDEGGPDYSDPYLIAARHKLLDLFSDMLGCAVASSQKDEKIDHHSRENVDYISKRTFEEIVALCRKQGEVDVAPDRSVSFEFDFTPEVCNALIIAVHKRCLEILGAA